MVGNIFVLVNLVKMNVKSAADSGAAVSGVKLTVIVRPLFLWRQ